MPGVISTGNHPKALWPGVKAWWGRVYGEHQEEYPALFEKDTSSQNYEEDVLVSGFGLAPVKKEGVGVQFDSETQGFVTRYTHAVYGLGYIVTKEEMEDNLYEMVSKRRAQANAFSMRQTKEIMGAYPYNNGFSAFTTGDAVALFSASHTSLAGSQSNILATAVDISETGIEDLLVQIMKATNHRGLKISLMPKSLHVPPDLWFEANRILKSVLQNDTGHNAVNVLKSTNALPGGIHINHYFTSATNWFIRTNAPRGPVFYERRAIAFTTDNDFDTENAKAKSTERYSFGVTDWRGVYASGS
jgi:hypothetical protein